MASLFSFTDNHGTITTTEFSIARNANYVAGTGLNSQGEVQAFIDLNALTAAESYVIRVYESVNAGTQRIVWEGTATGAVTEMWATPLLLLGGNWDVTVTKLAGTSRDIIWSVRQAQLDNATATATAVLAQVIEGSITLTQSQRLMLAALAGKADGFSGATQHYRDTADTKNRITAAVDATGRTAVTLDVS